MFSIKDIRLESVSSITTEAFLAGLRRLGARKSKSYDILSENAINFNSTFFVLKSFYQICSSEEIKRIKQKNE